MKELVKGYLKSNVTVEGTTETLWAVYPNGKIETCTRKYSSTFYEKSDVWTTTNELPEEAHFCGNYYMN